MNFCVIAFNVLFSATRDTCSDPTSGTSAGEAGCWTLSEQRWLRFEDNKVFLSNRGMFFYLLLFLAKYLTIK